MKTLADLMREGDPLTRDPRLSDAEAAAIRRRVVNAAGDQTLRRIAWKDAVAMAAAVAIMIAVGVVSGRRLPPPTTSARAIESDGVRPAERRQLQVATPGGTRIIWTFDSDFSVTETIP
jgi:hypothetical protein